MLNGRDQTDYEALLDRVKRDRCQLAFRTLFDHFYSKTLGYFRRSGVPPQKASDLAQETLLAVWHKSSFYDASKGSCSTWIFTLARNLRYDYLRSSCRDVLSMGSEDVFQQLEDPSLPSLDSKMASDDILRRIDSLPTEQRDAVRATYLEGYSHGEYAELRKIPLGTVKSRIRLALVQLKKQLEES